MKIQNCDIYYSVLFKMNLMNHQPYSAKNTTLTPLLLAIFWIAYK